MDFHTLYQRHAPHVRRFALFLCGDPVLADDIASETFVRAWISNGKIGEGSVKAYLFAIARNLYRDSLRMSRRRAPLTDAPSARAATLERDLAIKSELSTVLAAIQELPEADRTALLLRAQDGLSYEEIAQVLGLSLANVKVKIHRARLRLMKVREAPSIKSSRSGDAV